MTIKNFSLAAHYTPWSGAVDTWERIRDEDKVDDFERLIEECYPDGVDDLTGINDILWFESDWVYRNLGIETDEDEE